MFILFFNQNEFSFGQGKMEMGKEAFHTTSKDNDPVTVAPLVPYPLLRFLSHRQGH